MKKAVENVGFYILGGMVGVVLTLLIFQAHIPYFETYHISHVFIIVTASSLLVTAVIVEGNKERNLRENNRIRNETVALITHETRTGLTTTGWTIELMLQKYGAHFSPEDRKMLQDLVDSIRTTVMHSVNLLDISLMDIGKLSLALEWVGLDKVQQMLTELVRKFSIGAGHNGLTLKSDIHLDTNQQVEVDMLRLRIIVENLLENALQYTTGHGTEMELKAINNATHLIIEVRDTGMGIPKSEQDKLFTEFYRASNARKKLSSGSGIGLYLCKEYVNAHHGTISFTSEENKGTTFYVSIPLKTTARLDEFFVKI